MKKIIAGILLLLVVGLGFFQVYTYQEKTSCRDEALLYFAEEDYAKMITYLKQALKSYSIFAKDLDLDMNCYLAESYYQLKEYDTAEEIYDALIADKKDKAEYYVLKGRCVADSGDEEGAVKVYEEGFSQTGSTDFLKKICAIYVEQADYEKALSYAEKGVKEGGSTKKDFLFERIAIYEKAQDYEKAYEAASEYVKLYPDDADGQKEYTFLSTRIQ